MTDEQFAQLLEVCKQNAESTRRMNAKIAFLFWGPMILWVGIMGLAMWGAGLY